MKIMYFLFCFLDLLYAFNVVNIFYDHVELNLKFILFLAYINAYPNIIDVNL